MIDKLLKVRISKLAIVSGYLSFSIFYFFNIRMMYELDSSIYIIFSIYTFFIIFTIYCISEQDNFEELFLGYLASHFLLFYFSKYTKSPIPLIIVATALLWYYFLNYSNFKQQLNRYFSVIISYCLGLITSVYILYTQTYRKLLTPSHELELLNGTLHHDTLYRSAIANLFFQTGVPTVGINNLNIVQTHFFSEIYLSVFTNTLYPGESSLFFIYFFQIIFIPAIFLLVFSNKRNSWKLSLLLGVILCQTIINDIWGTKTFNNLPFTVSLIFFMMGYSYITKLNNQSRINLYNLSVLGVYLLLTLYSKILTGLALGLIFLLCLNYKKVDIKDIVLVLMAVIYPIYSIVFNTSQHIGTDDIFNSNWKIQTTLSVFILLTINYAFIPRKEKLPVVALFLSSAIFSYLINSGNQSFFLEFVVVLFLIMILKTSFQFIVTSFTIGILIVYFLTVTPQLGFVKGNFLNLFSIQDSPRSISSSYESWLEKIKPIESTKTVELAKDSFIWDIGYSCQYSYLLTQAVVSRPIIVYPPKELQSCKGYGISK